MVRDTSMGCGLGVVMVESQGGGGRPGRGNNMVRDTSMGCGLGVVMVESQGGGRQAWEGQQHGKGH